MNRAVSSMVVGVAMCMVAPLCWAEDVATGTHTLEEMAAPITDPTIFEDPRATTELRPIYIYHKISDDFITQGGSATIYALQARYAVNDRLSIIATKDGYVDLKTNAVLDDENGWADIAAGAKYAVYLDQESRTIITPGFRYEIPSGSEDVFQGQGKGAFNPFVSAAIGVGPVNLMASTGFRIAASKGDSSFYDLNLHADTKIAWFHPIVELGLTTVTEAGDRLPIADEGEDFFNFGAADSVGETLVSGSVGGRFDLHKDICLGAAYQFPLTNGQGSNILEYRVTSDLIFKF